jgi:hypothetical protein
MNKNYDKVTQYNILLAFPADKITTKKAHDTFLTT